MLQKIRRISKESFIESSKWDLNQYQIFEKAGFDSNHRVPNSLSTNDLHNTRNMVYKKHREIQYSYVSKIDLKFE